ncbi:MAG: SEC-C domain-containing protein [Nitrospirae bacterium]|nr:SEC-C domain-containing protein [Nitrospirota bacterium]
MYKAGRNDPCPCGSGKKYKKCCLVETFVTAGKEDTIRKNLIDALMRFYDNNYSDTIKEARLMFWEDFEPQEYLEDKEDLDFAVHNFFEWIVFDFVIDPDDNKTLIDLYLEQNTKLTQDQHKVLNMMKNACISLYEVQEVFPEKGLLLKDLLMGGEFDVKEKSATRSVNKWDIFGTRLLLIDGHYIMSGAIYPYSIGMKNEILEDIHYEYNSYINAFPDTTMDQFLKDNGDLFMSYWYEPFLHSPALPSLKNTSGEPLLFSKAIFEINKQDAVRTGLTTIEGFEQNQDDFTWYDKKTEDGDAIVLGRVEIQGDKLILECNSKKRLKRGKKLILDALQDAVTHKMDTFQEPMEAIKTYKEKSPQAAENDLPMDVQQQLYSQFMDKHYKNWFNDRIPALDNKTPLEAIKTEEGKKKVIELLKLYENVEELKKKKERPYYDIAWVWQRLGIDNERV